MERPEPVPMPPGSSAIAKAGRLNFSLSRAVFLDAERGHRLGFGLRQSILLDGLPLPVQPIELFGDFGRFDRIGFHQ
jgi:hypothetical protein